VDERIALLRQIGQITHDDPPAIFLWSNGSLSGVGPGVQGWQPHVVGYIPVVNVAVAP
jgi:ABC-type transport system substrate-binding protein